MHVTRLLKKSVFAFILFFSLFWRRQLDNRFEEIAANIRPRRLVAVMYESNALTLGELERIQSYRTDISAVKKLLKIVKQQPRQVYYCLLNALRETNQGGVYLTLIDVG